MTYAGWFANALGKLNPKSFQTAREIWLNRISGALLFRPFETTSIENLWLQEHEGVPAAGAKRG